MRRRPRAYLAQMQYFARLSPVRAVNDLRRFLAQRQKHELIFLFLSVLITSGLIAGFVKDSSVPTPYKRDILYFQNWRADRSDADMLADRQRDFVIKTRRDVMIEKRQADTKATFKRYDDQLSKWGL